MFTAIIIVAVAWLAALAILAVAICMCGGATIDTDEQVREGKGIQ